MKKFYSLLLLLSTVLFTANLASAYTLTVKWETPGSVEIKAGNIEYFAEPQDVTGKTEFVYTFGDYDNLWVGVSPGSGYKLVKAVQTEDDSVVVEPNGAGKIIFNGNGFSTNLTDKTYTIYVEQVSFDEKFNVNVINGLDYFKATYANGKTLNLEKGNHEYTFNSEVDGALTITLQGIPYLYSITLDGTAIQQESNKSYNIPIADGSNLVIQAFENPEVNAPETCKLTFEYGPDMEGCIYTIRDWTSSKFVEGDIVNNVLTIPGYTDLQLNFVENDYTITKVYLNDEDITSELVTSSFDKSQRIRFLVPNKTESTIKIEGTAKVWGTVDFTGYISGAEGVEFSETYGGDAMNMPEGTALTSSFNVGAYQLTPDNAKKYVFSVSEKSPKMFFRPKAGYYIAEYYVSTTNSPKEQNSGAASIIKDIDGSYFWMVVKPLGESYTFDMTTTGSTYSAKLTSADQSVISNWDNPEGLKVNLSEGTETVTFYPSYSIPALIAVSGDDSKSPAAYLDGGPLTGTVNADSNATEFTFTPYYPVAGDGIPAGTKSDVQVYLTTERPSLSGASLELEDGIEAEFYYSPIRHAADPAGQSVISGTQMIVKPSSPNAVVTYKDEVVTLDANGEFVFNAKGNARNNIVTISLPPKYADMLVTPKDGATVKSLSSVKITLPAIDPTFEHMLYPNMDEDGDMLIQQLVVKKGDEVVAQFAGMNEPTGDDDGNMIMTFLVAPAVTEGGNYTICVPEKAFVEVAWSEADDDWAPVKGGFVTPAYNGSVTVDPNALSVCDDYTLSPASGETVDDISIVKLTFNQISSGEYFSGWEFPNATFTNGETTVEAIVNYDWNNAGDKLVMTVTPIDANDEATPITAAGTWTMTIAAGTFSYDGESNGVITAEYTIPAQTSPYVITPASGTVTDNLTEIKIEFPAGSTVEYNDEVAITLVGTEYNASSNDVHNTGNSNIFTVSFRNPSVDGDYTVTFPAGAFTVNGQPSEVASAFYTFRKAYLLTPESGSTLKSFEVVISFPNATSVEYVGDSWSIMLNRGDAYAAPVNCVKDATASVPTFMLTLHESVQKPSLGNYNLTINEGAFLIDGKESVEISASYTIEPDVTAEYLLEPDGTIVYQDYGLNFGLIFDETASVTAPNKADINITFDGVPVPANAFECMSEGCYLIFMIYPDPQYNKDGVLNLKIAEGKFKVGGKPSPVVDATWNVVGPKTYAVNVTPVNENFDGKYQYIETIYINFPEATKGEVFNEYGARLSNQVGTITLVDAQSSNLRAESTGVTFAVTFPKKTAKGTYDLWVMDGTFTLDGVFASPEINETFTVDPSTAIAELFADENGNITVYTVDGKVILKNVPAAEVRNLQKGIYIINGKKVVLK